MESNLPLNTQPLSSQIYLDSENILWTGVDGKYFKLIQGDNYLLVGSNITLLNNNANFISNGTLSNQVRTNAQLDERYLQSETDPTVPSYVKSISTGDISNWNSKISSITGGTGITVDATDPYNPIISASAQSLTITGDVTGSGTGTIELTLANNSVKTQHLVDESVTTGKIADNAVTLGKIQEISRGTVLGLAGGGTNTWTLLTPSHGTYVGEWKPNFHAAVGFLVSYENKLYEVLNYDDPVPPPTNPSQYELIHSNFRVFNYGGTYTPGMLVVMGNPTSNYYTTSANITGIAPTDTPVNTPASPQELTIGDGLVVTSGGVLRTTGAQAITGLIQAGSNIAIAGNGTPDNPYIISATGGGGGGGSSTLAGLTDVNVAGALNGQVLTYNSGTWLPTTISGGSSFQLRSGSNSYLSGNVSLIAGTGVSLSQSGQNITITATGSSASVFTRSVDGLVPAPGGSSSTRYLREDGTWATPAGGGGGGVDLVTAGSATVGAVRYAGVTKTNGQWYGGVSNPTNTTRLNFDGILHAGGMVTYGTSDINLKTNLCKIENPLEKLDLISGYKFTWKDNDNYKGDDYGLIAQEVERILPEIIGEIGGYKAIKSGNQLTALLIEAVKELSNKVRRLENEL